MRGVGWFCSVVGRDRASRLKRVFERFKQLADKKKVVADRDLEAIVSDEVYQPVEVYRLEHLQVSCGDHAIATATVSLRGPDGEIITDAAHGTGPVDAVYKAINRLVGVPNQLTEFAVKAVTEGIDAVGEVTIRIEAEPNDDANLPLNPQTGRRTYVLSGHGASTDIVVASGRAYLSALNKLLAVIGHGRESA